jgi:hypothetical protein
MRYRQEAYSPDRLIAQMLGELRERVKGESLTLVLDGDVFDLDAPRVVKQRERVPRPAAHRRARGAHDPRHPGRPPDLRPTPSPRVLAEGHEVVMISGNHDVQLTLPEVREAVAEAPDRRGPSRSPRERAARRSIARRCASPRGVPRVVPQARRGRHRHRARKPVRLLLQLPLPDGPLRPRSAGDPADARLAHRAQPRLAHGLSSTRTSTARSCSRRSGTWLHWARYYLFSRHSLAWAWVVGAVRTALELLRVREPESRARRRANIAAAARETGVPLKQAARHARLCARPVEEKPRPGAARALARSRAPARRRCWPSAATWLVLADGVLAAGAALAPMVHARLRAGRPQAPARRELEGGAARGAQGRQGAQGAQGRGLRPHPPPRGRVGAGRVLREHGLVVRRVPRSRVHAAPRTRSGPWCGCAAAIDGRVEGGLSTWKPGCFTEQSPRPAA